MIGRAGLFLLLALGLGLSSAWAERPRVVLAATPIARLDLPWWRARFAAKAAELRNEKPELVFYGDSITQNYERSSTDPAADYAPIWRRFYGDRHAVNLGFTGDTTANLLWRIEHGEAEGIAPKVAVVLIGANNFGRLHWSAEDTLAGIRADVEALRKRLPRTKILLLGILPSGRGKAVERKRAQVNAALGQVYAHDSAVRFVDLSAVFLRDGRVAESLYLDPELKPPRPALHPSAEGQARMAAAIEPVLAALLGDRNHLLSH